MNLHVCPACEAFVSANWQHCRVCGHELEPVEAQLAEVTAVAPSVEMATETSFDTPVPDVPVSDVAATAVTVDEEHPWDDPNAWDDPDTWVIDEPEQPVAASLPAGVTELPADIKKPVPDVRAEPVFFQQHSVHSHNMSPDLRLDAPFDSRVFYIVGGVGALLLLIVAVGLIGIRGPSSEAAGLVDLPSAPITPATSTPPTTTPSGWIDYTDSDGYFTTELPTRPSRTSSGSADKRIVWQSDSPSGKSIVYVVAQDMPATGTTDQVLRAALRSDAQAFESTVSSQSITNNGGGTRELSARLTSKDGSVDVAIFNQNRTLYHLIVQSSDANGDPETFGHLSSTFSATK